MTNYSDNDAMSIASGISAFESREFSKAMRLLNPFADQGDPEAQYRVAIMLQNGLGVVRNEMQGYKMMKDAAEKGHALAQHGLGFMYLEGECVEQNGEKAIEWFARAAEQGMVKGVVTDNGPTRLIVVGDSLFLVNEMIDSAGNREFASLAINWLLDRSSAMAGVGPRPVSEFRVLMTGAQMTRMQWLLLAGLPLTVLAIGVFVYVRRKS